MNDRKKMELALAMTLVLVAGYAIAQQAVGGVERVGQLALSNPVVVGGIDLDGGVQRLRVSSSGVASVSLAAGSMTVTGQDGGYPVGVSIIGSITATAGPTVGQDGGYPVGVVIPSAVSGAHGEILVSNTTPTLVGGLAGRRTILVQNNGPNAIRCGFSAHVDGGAGVLTGTGVSLSASGGAAVLDITDAVPIYCQAATAAQVAGAATNFTEIR